MALIAAHAVIGAILAHPLAGTCTLVYCCELGHAERTEACCQAFANVQVDKLVIALERTRGAVQGMLHYHGCAVFEVVGPHLRALAAVGKLYAHHALIVALLFKLAASLVDAMLGVIETGKAEVCTYL